MKKLITILLLLISAQVFSQTLSTKNKKAIEYFQKALDYYNAYNYDKAIYWSELAIDKDKKFIEVYYLLSDIYGEIKQPKRKILMLKKAIVIAPQKSALAYFTLAKTELSIGKYEDAKTHLLELKKYDTAKRFALQTKAYIKKCEFGIHAMQNPVDFKPINLGKNINSEFNEYLPAITADEQTLIYTRLIPTGKRTFDGTLEMQEDFYISKQNKGVLQKSENFGKP